MRALNIKYYTFIIYYALKKLFVANSNKTSSIKNKPVFIIGTGRSGTHFLARTINNHPAITDLVKGNENPYVFDLVSRAAFSNEFKHKNIRKIIKRYQRLINLSSPLDFLDQSHPNIWHVDDLVEAFPNAKFLLIIRNPYSVVSSMMKHDGVLRWITIQELNRSDNKFLGIDHNNISAWNDMPIEGKCALRWAAHYYIADITSRKHSNNIITVYYDDLCENPEAILKKIQMFLGFNENIPTPNIDYAALTKRNDLSKESVNIIKHTLNQFFTDKQLSNHSHEKLKRLMEF